MVDPQFTSKSGRFKKADFEEFLEGNPTWFSVGDDEVEGQNDAERQEGVPPGNQEHY